MSDLNWKAVDDATRQQELSDAIAIVEEELSNIRALTGDRAIVVAGTADIAARLRTRTGSKLINDRPSWENSRVKIAGIQSTCTYGFAGALSNWLVAARARLQQVQP